MNVTPIGSWVTLIFILRLLETGGVLAVSYDLADRFPELDFSYMLPHSFSLYDFEAIAADS